MSGKFGLFQPFLHIKSSLGDFSLLGKVLISFHKYKLLSLFKVSVPLVKVLLPLVELVQSVNISQNPVVTEVENGMINRNVKGSLFLE